jgi:ribosomal protein L25 (general stress protein Ctc)
MPSGQQQHERDAVYELQAAVRRAKGKKACRQLRRQQQIPGVIFGRGLPDVLLRLPLPAFHRQRDRHGFSGRRFLLRLDDGSTHLVRNHQTSLHPATDLPLRLTFYRLADPLPPPASAQ